MGLRPDDFGDQHHWDKNQQPKERITADFLKEQSHNRPVSFSTSSSPSE
jgi:hypothetical protein